MKHLHQKKISELESAECDYCGEGEKKYLEDLKAWAIAKMKKCKNLVKEVDVGVIMSEKAPIYCGHTYVNSPRVERCIVCIERKMDHGITEEDLNAKNNESG